MYSTQCKVQWFLTKLFFLSRWDIVQNYIAAIIFVHIYFLLQKQQSMHMDQHLTISVYLYYKNRQSLQSQDAFRNCYWDTNTKVACNVFRIFYYIRHFQESLAISSHKYVSILIFSTTHPISIHDQSNKRLFICLCRPFLSNSCRLKIR